ncbi:MAG TPA: hypothetical protein VH081_05970 [Solirubrobacteraceae bacterium]|jgi:hypothetical protein|nr:hypothetical protein [Solirubrobacteraceae bacterium]
MDGLVNAVSELIASVLRRIGVVGLTRRRNAITSDLELLDRLREAPDFGAASQSHQDMKTHVEAEIRAYTGARKEWRKREWFTIIFAALLGAGFGYAAYRANAVGWWLAFLAWIPAGLFGFTALFALVKGQDDPVEPEPQGAA